MYDSQKLKLVFAYHVILLYKVCHPKTVEKKTTGREDDDEEDLGLDEDIDEDDANEENE